MNGEEHGIQSDSPGFEVEIAGPDVRFTCRADQSLLAAMIMSGHRSVTVGCRSGGCGVCRVRVLSGSFATGPMNRRVVSAADERAGIVLACRTYPRSEVCVEPLPRATAGRLQPMACAA